MRSFLRNTFFSFGFLVVLASSVPACQRKLPKKPGAVYDFRHPGYKYDLGRKLAEVSGLSYIHHNTLALIQDEDGLLFFYDLQTGKVTRKIPFSKDGDFEDVKVVGDTAYVLRSDGIIYEIKNLSRFSDTLPVKKYATALSSRNDAEGLCYDKQKNRLLIACKASPSLEKKSKFKGKKAIYAFDLSSKILLPNPVYLIDVNKVDKKIFGEGRNILVRVLRILHKTDVQDFQPSGISIHPLTREVYVISSAGNALVVLDSSGTLKSAAQLSRRIYKQPEGIAFDHEANLYISNEGRSGSGNILFLKYEPLIEAAK